MTHMTLWLMKYSLILKFFDQKNYKLPQVKNIWVLVLIYGECSSDPLMCRVNTNGRRVHTEPFLIRGGFFI